MTVDATAFRRVLGHVPTSVVVVAGTDGGEPLGLAVGSFTSVSLDPPLVGFFVGRTSSTWSRIEGSGAFCVNVLREDQDTLCRTFATPGADRFAEVPWRAAATGAPALEGALAWIDCTVESVAEAGDHSLVLGRVVELDAASGTPLVFFRGSYAKLKGQA